MDRLKRIAKRLLFLPGIIAVPLVILATVLLIYAFADETADARIVYGSYFLSAYALTVVCAAAPRLMRFIRRVKTENRYISRYTQDAHLRMRMSLYSSVTVNALYALLQLGYGLYHRSVWFYALAAYYALLAIMRYFLLKETKRQEGQKDLFMEYLLYRLCGVLLMVMNLALAIIVTYIVWQNRGFEHHYITTIAMATYTFYSVTMAIINVIRSRRHNSPILSATKMINMAAALVSILSLETAMLNAFGEPGDAAFRQIITALTGTGVCITVLLTAIFMIIHSTREINRIKGEIADGQ